MNYGGQTWSGGGGGGYNPNMGGINQGGPQQLSGSQMQPWGAGNPQQPGGGGLTSAQTWAQQNNPELAGRFNMSGGGGGSTERFNPYQENTNYTQGNWGQPGYQTGWGALSQGQGGGAPGGGGRVAPGGQQQVRGQGNWSSPYSTANSGWNGGGGGQPQSAWGGGTPQQGGGGQMANLMGSMYGNRRF